MQSLSAVFGKGDPGCMCQCLGGTSLGVPPPLTGAAALPHGCSVELHWDASVILQRWVAPAGAASECDPGQVRNASLSRQGGTSQCCKLTPNEWQGQAGVAHPPQAQYPEHLTPPLPLRYTTGLWVCRCKLMLWPIC